MDRRLQYILFAVWVLALASTPLWGSNYVVRLAVVIAMFTALTLSWNFIGGFAGYPSFSTAAFFGLGSYVGAISERAGIPMVVAWGLATLFTGAFAAALMGIKVNRIYAITFGIGTLMAGATGVIFAMVYPVTTNLTGTYLGKAFVICVIGGLGSVPIPNVMA